MNIAVDIVFDKTKSMNFSEISNFVYDFFMEQARDIVAEILKRRDLSILAECDTDRYVSKGLRKTSAKTRFGDIEFNRRVYMDKAAVEGPRYVYLLDQELDIHSGVGRVGQDVCQIIANEICVGSYRDVSAQLDAYGCHLSHQGVWNVVQEMGQHQREIVDRHTELSERHKSVGVIETPILFTEQDGLWLHLQGKDRKENGASKEMKIGIAYDGVVYTDKDHTGARRELDNKVAYASFESAEDFRKHSEAMIESRYEADSIRQRVLNGDGSGWVLAHNDGDIVVLDEFHRNKKLRECVRDADLLKILQEHLYSKDYDTFFICLDAQINSVDDEKEKEKLEELYKYYHNNRDYLSGYYDRGIEILPTRKPGVVHHARLGSMEGNVFTLVGNRMKGRRANWSIRGGNNLASLLCAKHTIGLERLFEGLPLLPEEEPPIPEEDPCFKGNPVATAASVPEREGNGYEYPVRGKLADASTWASEFSKQINHISLR